MGFTDPRTACRRSLTPPALAGRAAELEQFPVAELEQFRVLVGRLARGLTEQSMIIRGPRGVGKTALLNVFEDQAEAAGSLAHCHELTLGAALAGELARMLPAYADDRTPSGGRPGPD